MRDKDSRSSRRAVIAGALALSGRAVHPPRLGATGCRCLAAARGTLREGQARGRSHDLGAGRALGAMDPARIRQALSRPQGELARRPAGELAADRREAGRPPCRRCLDLLARRHARGPEARPAGEVRLAPVRRAGSRHLLRRRSRGQPQLRLCPDLRQEQADQGAGAAPAGTGCSIRNGPTGWSRKPSSCRGWAAIWPSTGASSGPRSGSRP